MTEINFRDPKQVAEAFKSIGKQEATHERDAYILKLESGVRDTHTPEFIEILKLIASHNDEAITKLNDFMKSEEV